MIIIVSYISDSYDRKSIYIINATIASLSGILTAFVTTYNQLYYIRCLSGIFNNKT